MNAFRRRAWCAGVLVLAATSSASAEFVFNPPGTLVPGSGTGRVDETVYVPGMRFPIEETPAFANSQVWGRGGSQGPGGGQCDAANYSYPWWDNYCESRSWDMPLCPSGTGHQGQDIRAATCSANVHWAVAAEAGTISAIGSYSVTLVGESGTRHRYLHMANSSLQVSVGDRVIRGQRLGRVSNEFGGTPTTVHLHYDLFQNVAGVGGVYVPTYMSLVRSYEELVGDAPRCEALPAEGGLIDDGGPCVTFLGPAASWRVVTGAGQDGDLRWTYAWDRPRSNWARFEVPVAETGEYELEVFLSPEWAQSQAARYEIDHAGGTTSVVVDQAGAGGWATLGTFTLTSESATTISVGDDTGEDYALRRQLVVDALRATRVVRPEPSDPDVSDTGELDGGVPDATDDVSDGATPDANDAFDATDVLDAPDAAAPDTADTSVNSDVRPSETGPSTPDTEGDPRTADTTVDGDARTLPDPQTTVRSGCGATGAISAPASALMLLALGLWTRRRRPVPRS